MIPSQGDVYKLKIKEYIGYETGIDECYVAGLVTIHRDDVIDRPDNNRLRIARKSVSLRSLTEK